MRIEGRRFHRLGSRLGKIEMVQGLLCRPAKKKVSRIFEENLENSEIESLTPSPIIPIAAMVKISSQVTLSH